MPLGSGDRRLWAAVVGQAIRLGFEDFENMAKEPGNPEETIRQMLSKEWVKAKADKIRLPRKPSPSSGSAASRVADTEVRNPEIEKHTTHLAVTDSYGGVVSSTQSLGPAMGSKVATPGLGFLWASTMGYLAASKPGERSASGISPLIVFRDGQPAYVAGAAGGSTIVMALVEILSRALDQGLRLPEAVAAPRFSLPQAVPPAPGSGLEADALTMEAGDGAAWTPDQLEQLRSWGFKVTPSRTALFGIFHGIYVDRATGQFEGVADLRWGGVAAALRR
jgi:gamma-glutamyltranspeptidase/glutathione hydrolase